MHIFSKNATIEKMKKNNLPSLPLNKELETPAVMKALVQAHRYLAELKGVAKTMPNEATLVSTLTLQEAQSSSEIENIITTQDALYRYQIQPNSLDTATKEVAHYAEGLGIGFSEVKSKDALTLNTIIRIQAVLEGNDAGFRKTVGTVLQNELTKEVVYTPPTPEHIPALMADLETFMNIDSPVDPLIGMAVIHHQFESIHPFYDGNGRTGRIINILFLVKEGLLDSPILYLSRYINQTKDEYYRLLQDVRDKELWDEWLIYLLRGVALTAQHTIQLIESIHALLLEHKRVIRASHKFYSQELLNNIFSHPYTKAGFIEKDIGVSRATATRYLEALAKGGTLQKHKIGRENYYVNHELVDLLFNLPTMDVG